MADELNVPPSSAGLSSADEIPAPAKQEVQEQEDETRKPSRKHRGSFWKRPPIRVYDTIFGYGVQTYQPMIDYLDAKDSGCHANKSEIHCPYNEERCMEKYLSSKPIKWYNNRDIDRYIDKGNKIVSQIRQNDCVAGKSGNVINRTHSNWSMSKKFVQLVKNSYVVDHRKLREEAAREREIEYQEYLDNYVDFRDKSRSSSAYRTDIKSNTSGLVIEKPKAIFNQQMSQTPPTTAKSNSRREILTAEIEEIMNTIMHSKLDHEARMEMRRQRLEDLDNQFDDVIQRLSNTVTNMNLKSAQIVKASTPYDNAQTLNDIIQVSDDLSLKNTFRRQQQMKALQTGVDELTRCDTSKCQLKNNLRHLDDDILNMNNRLTSVNRRHQQEREIDLDLPNEISKAKGEVLARRSISKHLANLDAEDEDIQYMRKQQAALKRNKPHQEMLPKRRQRVQEDKMSDVQARIMNRAAEMSNRTSEAVRINHRARYVNVYTPRQKTADPESIISPTRTELNIDSMAKSFASRGRFQRRFDIDDECDAPVSNLNTNAKRDYCCREASKPIPEVPSNSIRVRSAVIRARSRNALLGF